jgi:hypothetical protein
VEEEEEEGTRNKRLRCCDWFILERIEGCGARAEGKGKYGFGLILNPTQPHIMTLLIPVISRWYRLLVRNKIIREEAQHVSRGDEGNG